ncbi:MAG TPA: hypothetical protein VFN68_14290, partial [Acidimicrobiales bacterium]|nr:hypothetical protein [Acidimicrobiales bacterium]
DIEVPHLEGTAVMWGHCHHRATGGVEPEQRVLERMGLDVDPVKGGCCGLAGSWGFEKGKYRISMDCGEQGLLPAVRKASSDAVIVANGFSCKTQVAEAGTGRRALHLAEVMQLARGKGRLDGGVRPEDEAGDRRPVPGPGRRAARTLLPVAGAAAAPAVATLAALRRRRR